MEFLGNSISINNSPHLAYPKHLLLGKDRVYKVKNPEELVDGLTLPHKKFLSSLLPDQSIEFLENTIVHPVLDLQERLQNLRISYRGSLVPIAYASPDSEIGRFVKDKELTKLFDTINTSFPEIFAALQISPTMFRRNVDLDIEVTNPIEQKEVLDLLSRISGINSYEIRPFLTQFSLPGIPEIFINVINPLTITDTAEASEWGRKLNSEGDFYGLTSDRRFGISTKMEAARAFVMRNDSHEIFTFLRDLDRRMLAENNIDLALPDPSVPFGPAVANWSRNSFYLGCVFGTKAMQKAMSLPNININFPLDALLQESHNITDFVSDSFDRSTIIANNLALLIFNPKAFVLHQKSRPYTLAASENLILKDLKQEEVTALSIAASQQDLDDILRVVENSGMVAQNQFSYSFERVTAEIIADIAIRRETTPEQLCTTFNKTMEKSGSSYKLRYLDSLIKLFLLFDPWDTMSMKPIPVDLAQVAKARIKI